MISDEFETFGDKCFCRGQTKTKISVQKIIHFIKIFIFLKSRILIQKNIHFFKIQNIHSNKIFIFLKRAVSNRATPESCCKTYHTPTSIQPNPHLLNHLSSRPSGTSDYQLTREWMQKFIRLFLDLAL